MCDDDYELDDCGESPDETPDGEFARGCLWTFCAVMLGMTLAATLAIVSGARVTP